MGEDYTMTTSRLFKKLFLVALTGAFFSCGDGDSQIVMSVTPDNPFIVDVEYTRTINDESITITPNSFQFGITIRNLRTVEDFEPFSGGGSNFLSLTSDQQTEYLENQVVVQAIKVTATTPFQQSSDIILTTEEDDQFTLYVIPPSRTPADGELEDTCNGTTDLDTDPLDMCHGTNDFGTPIRRNYTVLGLPTFPDGTEVFTYRVELDPVAWYGAIDNPVGRINSTFFFTASN